MNIWQAIQKLDRLIFTTREMGSLMGISLSSAAQILGRLETKGLVKKMMRGLWALTQDRRFNPYFLVPFLEPSHTCYVSFISALHIYGVIGQIPQIITVASTAHTKKIRTPVGVYELHQIAPSFFSGFDWHSSRNFLIATPEKALVDCLYLASRKGKKYGSFPELNFPPHFKKTRAKQWASQIKDHRVRISVFSKLKTIFPKG